MPVSRLQSTGIHSDIHGPAMLVKQTYHRYFNAMINLPTACYYLT